MLLREDVTDFYVNEALAIRLLGEMRAGGDASGPYIRQSDIEAGVDEDDPVITVADLAA